MQPLNNVQFVVDSFSLPSVTERVLGLRWWWWWWWWWRNSSCVAG